MKVVLFCGGLGTRLKEYSETIPKPLVNIGYRPVMWHLMRYYAHFGHNEFVLCLGYRGDLIKEYFLHYNECLSNDFVMRDGGRQIDLLNSDIDDWRITFVDTGQQANIGQRLVAVRRFVDDDVFLANYSDALTDLDLNSYVARAREAEAVATLLAVRTSHSFHAVTADDGGWVTGVGPIRNAGFMVNGGFFVLRPESSSTSATARSWWSSRSAGWSPSASCCAIRMTASGGRWIPSRIRCPSITCTNGALRRGNSGGPDGARAATHHGRRGAKRNRCSRFDWGPMRRG